MNPLDALFQRLRSQGRKAFIPFITAGDPNLEATAAVVRRLADCGADVIEIGFPYSDPIADGPIIQASYTRALERGIRTDDIFACIRKLSALNSQHLAVPLVAMVSYSMVHRRGPAAFVEEAAIAGFAGMIVPDLPADEAESLARIAAARDFKLIQLIAPTTPPARTARIVRFSTGFIYYISVTGITGERDRLPDDLAGNLRRLRQETDLPICVGFGINNPEQVRLLHDLADGIIVGSALVRRLEAARSQPLPTVLDEVQAFARSLVAALNP